MRPLLDEDQEFFRSTTSRFLDEFASPAQLRDLRHDPIGFDPSYWRGGADLGWMSLLAPESLGGGSISGDGLVDLTLVAHEFGAHAAPGPLLSCNLAIAALAESPSHHHVIEQLMNGSATATWCDATGAAGRTPPSLRIAVDGNDVILTGTVRPVEIGLDGGWLVAAGSSPDGLRHVVVPLSTPGIEITPLTSVDFTRRYVSLGFDGVRVDSGALVEHPDSAAAHQRLRSLALVLSAAESVGTMQRALDITVEWAFDRYSFGRPLASYQALKHRFADMKAWLEGAHAITDEAATAVAAGSPDGDELALIAAAFSGSYGSELMQDCVQLHGGLGVTYEHDIHLFFRRHTMLRTLFGTPGDHRQRITDLLANERSVA